MKMYEGCSGDCCTCAHEGCCPAVNGKDCYCLAPKEKLIERLKTGKYKRYLYIMIDTLKDAYSYDYEKKLATKRCKECGKEFEPKRKNQVCCCKECQAKHNAKETSERNAEVYREAKAKKEGKKRWTSPLAGKSSTEISVDAKKEKMSYGQYVAMKEYPVKIERRKK